MMLQNPDDTSGNEIYNFAKKIFPICRSLTGEGVRITLDHIKKIGIDLRVHSIPSGTKVFDWEIPNEWNIIDAYIISPEGDKIVDFSENNLHVLGYSMPIDKDVSLKELQNHLYTIPSRPEAIPYVTSYYSPRWGFCISHNQKKALKDGIYRVVIKSDLSPGVLNYGEVIIPGESKKEVFLSTYICHPSMANNEVSGPAVASYLARWLYRLEKNPRYTYRIVFVPETIGSIAYIHRNLEILKSRVIAGINITCVGDQNEYSYLPSREGGTLADRVVMHVLSHIDPNYKKYSFLDRGSDERQYCSPGVDLPLCSFMRSKYAEYPEYHTSDDNLDYISASGLYESYDVLKHCIEVFERNKIPKSQVLCEPQLGKRGLYNTVGGQTDNKSLGRKLTDVMAYADGRIDMLTIADLIGLKFSETAGLVDELEKNNLIKNLDF